MKSPLSVQAMAQIIENQRENFKSVGLAIADMVKLAAKEDNKDVESYLKQFDRVRGWYRDSLTVGTGEIKDFQKLVRILQMMKLDYSWLFQLAFVTEKPWSSLPAKRDCLVCIGEHLTIQKGWKPQEQQMVSRYDIAAFELFSTIFAKQTGSDNEQRRPPLFQTFDRRVGTKDIEARIANFGMIVAIGAVAVNPVSGSLFASPTSAPVRINLPTTLTNTLATPCFFPQSGTTEPSIEFRGDKYPAMEERGSKFVDYGIIAIDCSGSPIRVICSGVGGVGTIASVAALEQTVAVSDALNKSANDRSILVVKGTAPQINHYQITSKIEAAFDYDSGEEIDIT